LSDETRSDDETELRPDAAVEADDTDVLHGQPRPGEIYLGRYRAEMQIGKGGMGTVWLVRHLELDALRALKLIVAEGAFDPRLRARFRREARVMARLSHPNAVTVHDASIGRGSAFIEMEYIRGPSLNRLFKPGVPMPLDWTARILEQLCDVLHETHTRQIVHRDLKPSNLMLVADRPVGKELLKVLDFGIAKILGSETEASGVITGTGAFLGSAPWTSPEQASGGPLDARSDLYSVGILLYEMLTGFRPFSGQLVRLVYDHVNTPPPRFAAVNPALQIPPAIEDVVRRCLAKRPADRPQTARDLAAEFQWAIAEGRGSRVSLPASAPTVESGETQSDFEDLSPATLPGHGFPLSPATPHAAGMLATEPATALGAARASMETEIATLATDPGATTASPATAPDATKRRSWSRLRLVVALGLVGLALLVADVAIFGFRSQRSTPRVERLPEGYRAESHTGDARHAPALVRTRDRVRFVGITGGTFLMGNDGFDKSGSPADEDRPAHRVTLSDYYLQETEVTNGELDAYFRHHAIERTAQPKRFRSAWDRVYKAGRDPARFPAVGIDHDLAMRYAQWVGGKLPTEAQWEYAARSRGKPRRFVWEGDEMPNRRLANIDSLSADLDLTTAAVSSFPKDRSDEGLFDLTGNVREWCRDRWTKYAASTSPSSPPLHDPAGPDAPQNPAGPLDHVVRGGSFATWYDLFRTTRPRRVDADDRTARQLVEDRSADDLGFRVVIEWPVAPEGRRLP
jgi:serine/threonine protein kinase/formylglycine-generating enzyme required for sulfatase activity